ncbi:MAG: histidine kinase [Rubrivivax sp.]|nr:histidine kinase [Rubrivivax sp.]
MKPPDPAALSDIGKGEGKGAGRGEGKGKGKSTGGGKGVAPLLTHPPSLWPDSARAGTLHTTSIAHSGLGVDDDPDRARTPRRSAGDAAFDVCHPALALRAVLLVQAALALVALADADSAATWLARQGALAFGGVAATGLWLVVVCALRPRLQTLGAAQRTAVVLLMGAAAALLAWALLSWATLSSGNPWRAAAVALGGMALAALLWAWLDLRARIWRPANASARLAELQSRIRPHFLFNALNTALALVRVDPARAESVLEDLAELFRAALAEVGTSVTLFEEMELARRYLDIEQIRFGERLVVQWDIDPRCHAARVPPLVLQPLVENAVRHGIEPAPLGGLLRVHSVLQRGQVVLTVSNTLGGADGGPANPGHGMALANIRERLHLLHDVAAQCDVWREPPDPAHADTAVGGRFHARIVLPSPP